MLITDETAPVVDADLRRIMNGESAMSSSRTIFRRRRPTAIDDSLEFFEGLTRKERERAAQLLTPVDVGSGRVLGRRGEVGREFIVVMAGQVAVSVDGEALAVLEAGHHFGAIPLLDPTGNCRRLASFETLTPATLAVANRAEFGMLMRDIPALRDRVHSLAAGRQAYFDEQHAETVEPSIAVSEVPAFPVDMVAAV